MEGALRLLQAGDFRLGQPMDAVPHLPRHLQKIVVEARERAAARVFDAALAGAVELVLLTGELGNLAEHPQAAWRLSEWFQRLKAAEIDVVWAAPEKPQWPTWADIPENVRILQMEHCLSFRLLGSDRVVEVEWSSDIHQGTQQPPNADVLVSISRQPQWNIAYLSRGSLSAVHHTAGPTQPDPREARRSGRMYLTDVPQQAPPREPEALLTSSVRWMREHVILDDQTSLASLQEELQWRLERAALEAATPLSIVDWVLEGEGRIWNQLCEDSSPAHLLSELQSQHDAGPAFVWSRRIERNPSSRQLAAWKADPAFQPAIEALESETLESVESTGVVSEGSTGSQQLKPVGEEKLRLDEPARRQALFHLIRELVHRPQKH